MHNFFKHSTAELPDSSKAPAGLSSEVGVAGEVVFTGFKNEEARTDKITIAQYAKMIDTDGTAESLYNILTLPIMATSYRIVADKDDAGEVQADFVRKNLLTPPHKGGMETPFNLFLRQMMRAFYEGFQLFERVYTVKESKLVLRKLAHRDSTGITLKRDDSGGFGGAVQRVNYNGEWKEVEMSAHKSFLFTYGKERDFLYGRSAFKAAYTNYDKKRRLEYLDSIALQADAIKPKYLTRIAKSVLGTDDKNKLTKALAALARLGERNPVASIPYGYELNTINSEGRDPGPSIERQNAEMARSVLAQFILLGTQGSSSVGSFALADSSADIFKIALKGTMQNIEEHINFYLIPDLIDLNFSNPHYPEFHFDDLTSDAQKVMSDAFMKLIEKDRISEEMVKGIEDATASRLEIDTSKIKNELDRQGRNDENNKPPTPPVIGNTNNDGSAAGGSGKFPDQQLSDDQQWWRALTPAEQTVKLSDLSKRMDGMERQFIDSAAPIIKTVTADIIKRAQKDKPNEFDVILPADYSRAIMASIKTSYNYAKTGAADELRVNAPATSKDALAGMQQLTDFVVGKQQDDLKNLVRAELLRAGRTKQFSDSDQQAQGEAETPPVFADTLAALLGAWFVDKLKKTASSIVAQGVNNGRNDVFEVVAEDGDRFQYSAILDGKCTNGMCPALDGKVVDKEEYLRTKWKPPMHFHCRCIWVLIRKIAKGAIDTAVPKITGMPDTAGGKAGPLL